MCQHTEKDDRRIARSKSVLRKALVELLEKQPADSISVKDLVEQAQIARSTFYLYYLDKFDFFDKIMEETLALYEQEVQSFDDLPYRVSILKRSEGFFEYIAKNADFYRVMLGNNGIATFRNRMAEVGYRHFYLRYEALALRGVSKERLTARSEEFSILANYVVEGRVSTTSTWLNSGMRLSPHYLARVTSSIVYGILVDQKILSPSDEPLLA